MQTRYATGAGEIRRPFDFGGIACRRELGDFEPTVIPSRAPTMTAHSRSFTPAPTIGIEVRFVSSLTKFSGSPRFAEKIEVPAETTVGDLVERYRLPVDQIARVLCNGQDMNPGNYTGGKLDLGASLSDGDVITFAGPAPEIPGVASAAV